jgi:hypothetical protein
MAPVHRDASRGYLSGRDGVVGGDGERPLAAGLGASDRRQGCTGMTTSAGNPSLNRQLAGIALLTRGKSEPHGPSQPPNGHMYLGAQAASRATERLIFRQRYLT